MTARSVSSSSTWTDNRSPPSSGPATNRPSAGIRLPNSSSSRTGSTPPKAGRRNAGQCRHQIGHQPFAGSVAGYFRDDGSTRRTMSSAGSSRTTISSSAGPSAARSSGQGPLLRQLRVRARTARQHLEHAVPRVQHHVGGAGDEKDGRGARRLSAFPADEVDGEGTRPPFARDPFGAANSNHPAGTNTNEEINREFLGQLTQVIGNRALNEIKGGYAKFQLSNANLTTWSLGPQQGPTRGLGGPRIRFQGFQVPGNANHPRVRYPGKLDGP